MSIGSTVKNIQAVQFSYFIKTVFSAKYIKKNRALIFVPLVYNLSFTMIPVKRIPKRSAINFNPNISPPLSYPLFYKVRIVEI